MPQSEAILAPLPVHQSQVDQRFPASAQGPLTQLIIILACLLTLSLLALQICLAELLFLVIFLSID